MSNPSPPTKDEDIDGMKANLKALLIPVLMLLLQSLAAYLKLSIQNDAGSLLAIATSLAGILVGFVFYKRPVKQVARAEAIAPGITKIPPGSATKATIEVADPDVPNIEHDNPKTP